MVTMLLVPATAGRGEVDTQILWAKSVVNWSLKSVSFVGHSTRTEAGGTASIKRAGPVGLPAGETNTETTPLLSDTPLSGTTKPGLSWWGTCRR